MKSAIPEHLPIRSIDYASLIPEISRANHLLGDYNGLLRHLPNAQLLLAPIMVQEAVLSSRIEGTLATLSDVLLFEAGAPPERASRQQDIEEILNYRQAIALAVYPSAGEAVWRESAAGAAPLPAEQCSRKR